MHVRTSVPDDVPRLRELWTLAFGDGAEYQDNFFDGYYRPERVLVLEEDGAVQAMTAWFGSDLVLEDGARCRCAYLYAVATHPDRRGRGLAGRLLAACDAYLAGEGFAAVSTVPARPDLHVFFGQNGFRECFVQGETERIFPPSPPSAHTLRAVTPAQYRALREGLLAGCAHIDLDEAGIDYQAGACRLSGGGLYHLDGAGGGALVCLEGAGDGVWYLKELLGAPDAREAALCALPALCGGTRFFVRSVDGDWQFGMLKWLDSTRAAAWDWTRTAYLGPAFD